MGYVDGASLYEFVGGNPVDRLDPSGLTAVDIKTDDPKVLDAFKKLQDDPVGKELLNKLDDITNEWGVNIILHGEPKPGTEGSRCANAVENAELHVYIDPLDEIGIGRNGTVINSKATGDEPDQVTLGAPLDARIFHELSHAIHVIGKTDKGKHPNPPWFCDEKGRVLPEKQKDLEEWSAKWGNWAVLSGPFAD